MPSGLATFLCAFGVAILHIWYTEEYKGDEQEKVDEKYQAMKRTLYRKIKKTRIKTYKTFDNELEKAFSKKLHYIWHSTFVYISLIAIVYTIILGIINFIWTPSFLDSATTGMNLAGALLILMWFIMMIKLRQYRKQFEK